MKNAYFAAGFLALSSTVVLGEAVELKMKWTPGKKYVQEQVMDMTMDMNMNGQQMQTDMDMTNVSSISVKHHEEGVAIINRTTRIKMSTGMGGNVLMAFDSDKDKVDGNPMAAGFKDLLNKDITVVVKDDKVVKVEGMPNNAQMKQMGMDDEVMKKTMQMQFDFLPSEPVKVGDTWKKQVEMPLGGMGVAKMDLDMELDSIGEVDGKKVAIISLDGKFKGDMDVQGMKIQMDAKKYESKMTFSIDDGQFIKAEVKMLMDADMQQMGKMSMDMNMTQTLKEPVEAVN